MGSLHLDPAASLASRWEHRTVGERPTLLASGRGASAMVHTSDSNRTGSAAEMQRRFARDAAEWIATQSAKSGSRRTLVFAPPHLLGLLRDEMPEASAAELLHGDLVRLSAGELAAHPAVVAALSTAPAR
ncbi:MAG: host attachment protein [Planctomycetaceae bacterium]|nr:host attachment protein [Planctomycetaceae bacterium]